ncbi:MAG: ThiF family adenylyltransferase [Patescibacteria group bacterium]
MGNKIIPKILNTKLKDDLSFLSNLISDDQIEIIDIYQQLLGEYLVVKNPVLKEKGKLDIELKKLIKELEIKNGDLKKCGTWIYYPWSRRLIHCLTEEEFYSLRTARNNNLVTVKEQKLLKNFRVGIIGLSVGQISALTLSISGMCKRMKLADPDVIEATNLNRIFGGIDAYGQKKTDFLAKKIYDIDPFAELKLYPFSINKDNLNTFLLDDYKVDAVIDAFDDVRMKIDLRIVAKKLRIPVFMATDLGDGAIIDIERFDIDPNLPIFNGRIEKKDVSNITEKMTYNEVVQIATKMIGVENIPKRMIDSLKLVGQELSGHPQLALASFLGGSMMAYAVKQVALGKVLKSERVYISFENLL